MEEEVKVNQLLETLAVLSPMDENGTSQYPSLKAFAEALEVAPQRLYTVSKQPKEGEIYNANEYNWDAIERFVERRLDPDKGLNTIKDVVTKALEYDALNRSSDKRKIRRSGNAMQSSGYLAPNGSLIPPRKFAAEVGDQIMLRRDEEPIRYEIVMLSETSVVVQRVDTPLLSAYSNWTANQHFVVGEDAMERVTAQRIAALNAIPATQDETVE